MKSSNRKTLRISAVGAAGLISLCASTMSLAAEQWGSGEVRYVYPMANGSFVVTLSADPPGCPATSSPKYLYVASGENGVTADGLKAMLATALTALATGKQLQVAFSDTTTNCYVNRLLVVN